MTNLEFRTTQAIDFATDPSGPHTHINFLRWIIFELFVKTDKCIFHKAQNLALAWQPKIVLGGAGDGCGDGYGGVGGGGDEISDEEERRGKWTSY